MTETIAKDSERDRAVFFDFGVCSSPSSVFFPSMSWWRGLFRLNRMNEEKHVNILHGFSETTKNGQNSKLKPLTSEQTDEFRYIDKIWRFLNVNCFITIICVHFHYESWRFHKLHMTTSLIPRTFQITTVEILTRNDKFPLSDLVWVDVTLNLNVPRKLFRR